MSDLELLKTKNPHVLTMEELRSMKPEKVLWQTYRFVNDDLETDVVFWTGFGVFDDRIDGKVETICYLNDRFDCVTGYGIDFIFWSDRPSEQQVKEYVWKTSI